MTCINCEAENPPGRSTCTMCSQTLSDGTISTSAATEEFSDNTRFALSENQYAGLSKKLKREPGSSLYVTWGKSRKEKKAGAPPVDLKDIAFSEWTKLFSELPADSFAFSSDLEVDPLKGDGSLLVRNTSTEKPKKGMPIPFGPAIISIVVYPTSLQEDVCLDLHVASAKEVADVARDFLRNPHELLNRYDWQPSPLMTKHQPKSSPPQKPNNANSSYIAPVAPTTYFISEDLEF